MRRKCYFEFLHDSNFNPDPLLGIHIHVAAVQKSQPVSLQAEHVYTAECLGQGHTLEICHGWKEGNRVLGDCIFCIYSDARQNMLI